jgi:hypothetical protein
MWRRSVHVWYHRVIELLNPPCSFFCATIAAITLKVLDPFGTGKLVLFQVTYDKVMQFISRNRYLITEYLLGLALLRTFSIPLIRSIRCMISYNAFPVTC